MSKYKEADLLRLAKRFHNTKRTYLLVDPLQGKHLCVSPSVSMELFHTLGREISKSFNGIRLVIGFAETATAVGMAVAEEMPEDCVYMHTTREEMPEVSSWIEFNEEHSHAVDQKLDATELNERMDNTECIVFIDDEISTGKTVINFINQLQKKYPQLKEKKLVVGSIINRLSEDNKARFKKYGIEYVSILELDEIDYEDEVKDYLIKEAEAPRKHDAEISYAEMISTVKLLDPRNGMLAKQYCQNCKDFSDRVLRDLCFNEFDKDILVLGTEECMYPAIVLGEAIENLGGMNVYTHSTTRSPIGICSDADYPIKNGYKLKSFYDRNRITYIYNLRKYDRVLIVTDSEDISEDSIESLTEALLSHGNDNILLIRG